MVKANISMSIREHVHYWVIRRIELLQLSVQDISVSVKDGAGIQQLKKEGN